MGILLLVISMVSNEFDPPIREFLDRGTLWLLESPENLRDLVCLMAREIADGLDFSRAERINRSFVPDDLHKQEADLLYRVPYKQTEREVWIYLLLEHQSRPDRLIGLRLLSYMVQVWETQRRGWEDVHLPHAQRRLSPIVPMVFYTGKRSWKSPLTLDAMMEVPAALASFIPRHETLVLKLREIPAETLQGSVMACILQVMQAEDAPLAELERVLARAVSCLDDLAEEHQAEWRRAIRYLLLLIRHRRAPQEMDELFTTVTDSVKRIYREEVEEMTMTSAQVLLRQGRQEGRQEGYSDIILEQLQTKFGSLSAKDVDAVKALPPARLKELALWILTAQSLADLHLEA